jgi:hypothetical protein
MACDLAVNPSPEKTLWHFSTKLRVVASTPCVVEGVY